MTSFYIMDPDSRLDYDVNWAPWLDVGDTIVSTTFTVVDVGIDIDTPTFTTTRTKIWATGGVGVVTGREYRVMNEIATTQGRVENQTLVFLVEQK